MTQVSPESTKIGFIGCGVMGSSMISNLLEAGYDVSVWTRTKAKAEGVVAQGAHWADTRAGAIEDADVIITIVGYPSDVEEVYLDEGGIIDLAKEGAYLIDMTTSSPKLAKDIFGAAAVRGLHALDAPVSGGDVGAKNGTLTIMAGGEEADFIAVAPLFEVLGKKAMLQGPAGSGQHTKMANQIALAGAIVGTIEAISYAKDMGLDPAKVLESISAGSGTSWQLENMGPRILEGDFAPGFFSKHFLKDLSIALEEADEANLLFPGLEAARELYDTLVRIGGEDMGTQGLYVLYAGEEACRDAGLDLSKLDEIESTNHNPDVYSAAFDIGGFGTEGSDSGDDGLSPFMGNPFYSNN